MTVDALMSVRKALSSDPTLGGVKLTMLSFIVKVCENIHTHTPMNTPIETETERERKRNADRHAHAHVRWLAMCLCRFSALHVFTQPIY